jgi:hypothetical protein
MTFMVPWPFLVKMWEINALPPSFITENIKLTTAHTWLTGLHSACVKYTLHRPLLFPECTLKMQNTLSVETVMYVMLQFSMGTTQTCNIFHLLQLWACHCNKHPSSTTKQFHALQHKYLAHCSKMMTLLQRPSPWRNTTPTQYKQPYVKNLLAVILRPLFRGACRVQ